MKKLTKIIITNLFSVGLILLISSCANKGQLKNIEETSNSDSAVIKSDTMIYATDPNEVQLQTIITYIGDTIEPIEHKRNDIEKVYTTVEQMPQYPGGDAEMYAFISKNLKFPQEAIENGTAGHRIIIRFVIHRSGKVISAEVLRSINPQCDSIALDVINNMPDWIPGKQDGQNVSVYYMLPISIRYQ